MSGTPRTGKNFEWNLRWTTQLPSPINFPVEKSDGNDGKGGGGGGFGSDRHATVGLQDFAQNNEPTFDRGEAASKLKDAWRSTLISEGKMGSDKKTLGDAAKETTKKAATVRSEEPAKPEEPADA